MNRMISVAALAAGLLFASPALADGMVPPPQSSTAVVPAQQQQQQQQQRPNVLLWMLDDVGFAQLSCFGGLVPTPNIDRVARMGLRYSNYHTAPICSASRAAILTGRMPHSVHVGGHAAAARPYPGYDADIPPSAGTIAANLKAGGYTTFGLGKWDHLPTNEITPNGPFNHWPTGQGFDRFYGFLAADADNFHPTLVRDLSAVQNPDDPNYHLNHDLANQAIGMIRMRGGSNPARPFFMYWATGTAHAPHHAPKEWIERFRGKFDMGWDKAREQILRAQVAQGILPRGTKLAVRPEGMPAWDTLNADQKRLFARQMEVFAASLAYADHEFGRILDALEASGELADTMVIITSDNGASAEGAPNGTWSEHTLATGEISTLEDNLPFYDDWGSARTYPHYSFGWAVAGDTPFRYYKQTTHEGGTRVPLVVAWPNGIAARGEWRSQFTHVSDIAPTILAATGVPLAPVINNVQQSPMEGQNVAATFADAKAPGHQGPQYVEMYGNKGLWQDGWAIVTDHRFQTWNVRLDKPIDEPWALYDLTRDPGQTTNVAARYPQKVAAMAAAFEEQAVRYQVNPIGNISDALPESFRKAQVDFERRGGRWSYAGPVGNITGQMAPPIMFRPFRMTATVDLAQAGATSPVFAYGGQLGGIGLYLRQGKPVFLMIDLKGRTVEVASGETLSAGAGTLELEVDHASVQPGEATDYTVTIRAGGRTLAHQTVRYAMPLTFGIAETFGVGIDDGSTIVPGARSGQPFAGSLTDVVFQFPTGGPAARAGH